MKILDKFILKSFIGPFILTFFIAVFVLLMQFIWLYVDEMIGKGIEWYVIAELLFYSSANVVPMALPLSVLLASLMTFGNLGEHFELVSCKAAGISLQKVMRSLFVFIAGLSMVAFLFANYVMPVANLKFFSLLYDIRSKKPAVNIMPGVFYSQIEGYTIRVKDKKKLENGDELLKDVMIYNHTNNDGNRKLTVADSAIMKMAEDKSYFSIKMFNGTDYQDQYEAKTNKVFPLSRFSFEENEVRISLAGFEFSRTDEDAFKHDYRLFNLKQLDNKIDTLNREYEVSNTNYSNLMKKSFLFNDTLGARKMSPDQLLINNATPVEEEAKEEPIFFAKIASEKAKAKEEQIKNEVANENLDFTEVRDENLDWQMIFGIALNNARINKGRSSAAASEMVVRERDIARMGIEWHRKLTFSLACFIMFLIGAPLGAIVKKGGLGMPVVISVIFFLFFWVLSIVGEDITKELVLPPYLGMWIASAVLIPLGFFFTYKATTDSEMFNFGAYKGFFAKLFKLKKNQ